MASVTEIKKVKKDKNRPGWVLWNDFMKPKKMSQSDLADALRVKQNRISDIIYDKRRITANTALRLACYFGNKAEFWLGLQSQWDIKKEFDFGIGNDLRKIEAYLNIGFGD